MKRDSCYDINWAGLRYEIILNAERVMYLYAVFLMQAEKK